MWPIHSEDVVTCSILEFLTAGYYFIIGFIKNRLCWLIGLMGRVFANCPGDRGSIPGRGIPKTLQMVLDTSLLNTQQYKVRIKWSNPGKGIVPSPTPRFSCYWKGSLQVRPRLQSPTLVLFQHCWKNFLISDFKFPYRILTFLGRTCLKRIWPPSLLLKKKCFMSYLLLVYLLMLQSLLIKEAVESHNCSSPERIWYFFFLTFMGSKWRLIYQH